MVHILNYIKKNKLLWPLIIVAFLAHMAIIVPSGTDFCFSQKCGLYFFGVHGNDMIWHLAISAVSFNTIPFIMPIYAGAVLSGYNYLMDFVVFLLSKIGIPTLFSYFKLLPLLWFICLSISTIRFGMLLNKSAKFIALLYFFIFFGGSFAYLISFMHHHGIDGSAGLVAMQSIHNLANLQYALSLIFVVETLILIKKGELNWKTVALFSLYIFITIGLKFYGGVILLFLIGIYLVSQLLISKKLHPFRFFSYGFVSVFSAALSIVLFYNPFTSTKTGAIFSFVPFATVHPIIETPELFYLPKLVNARYALQGGKLGPRLFLIEAVTFCIFLFFNFGTRLFGFFYLGYKSIKRKLETWEVLVLLTIIFSILLNILFVQKGEWWNTVQFLYYGIFLANIFTAQFLFSLLETKKMWAICIVVFILLATVPIDIDLVKDFVSPKSMAYIPQKELEALAFLKKQPKGVVFQPLYSQKVTDEHATIPHPLFANYDNSYVAAFSDHQVYFTNLTQIRLTGIDYKEREKRIRAIDCSVTKEFQYAYIIESYRDEFFARCIKNNSEFKKIFDNSEVWIYKKI